MPELSPTRPLPPPLPWDVVLVILQEADTSTLAAFAGTCYELMESVAPMLYEDVVINSSEGLKRLFCEIDSTAGMSRIHALLCLSQIQTLTLDFSDAQTPLDPRTLTASFSPSSSRLPKLEPLSLEVFNLTLHYNSINLLSSFQRSFFPLLNPRRFNSNVILRPLRDSSQFGMGLLPVLVEWSRTTVIDLKGVIPSSRSKGDNNIVGLPPPVPASRRVVRLHLNSLLGGPHQTLAAIAPSLVTTIFWTLNGAGMQDKTIVLVVASEDDKRQVQIAVAHFIGRRARKFEFVVE